MKEVILVLLVFMVYSFQLTASNSFRLYVNNNSTSQVKHKILIKGTVADEEGQPIPFAAVCFKGTTSGCVAAENGTYSIEVPNEKILTLEISSLGYVTQNIEVGGKTIINIVLIKDIKNLDEVKVVGNGYQTLSKERSTGAFGKVKKNNLAIPSVNITERLQGELSGVNINPSGRIEIRGLNTINGNAKPLVVVDGFPTESGLNSIDPNSIADITILKDAAAASIWGAKAANGVIVITTKRGHSGSAKVSFSTMYRTSGKLDFDYLRNSASSSDFLNYEIDYFKYASRYSELPSSHTGNEIDKRLPLGITYMNEHKLGNITDSDFNKKMAALRGSDNLGQIRDDFLRNPLTQQYNFTISGGSAGFTNYLSVTYNNNKKGWIGDHSDGEAINYRNNTNITKWLALDFGATLRMNSYRNKSNVYRGVLTKMQPYDMLRNSDGSLVNMNYLNYYQPYLNDPKSPFHAEDWPYPDWSYNPITDKDLYDNHSTSNTKRLTGGLTIKLLKGLSMRSSGVYARDDSNNRTIYKDGSIAVRREVNETSSWMTPASENEKVIAKLYGLPVPLNKYGKVVQNIPNGGILKESHYDSNYYDVRNQINYNKMFGEKHILTAIGGMELSDLTYKSYGEPDVIGYYDETLQTGQAINYGSDVYGWLHKDITEGLDGKNIVDLNPQRTFVENTTRLFSMYTNVSYTFNKKYNFTTSIRDDAANIISNNSKQKYSPFWSVGIGWHMQDEKFLRNINWLDRLTLRATLGEGGNYDSKGGFRTLLSVIHKPDNVTKEKQATIDTYGNPDLSWEKTRTTNLGLDFAVLHGKLSGSIDVYNKASRNLLVNESISSNYGHTLALVNDGEMYNRGVEISLRSSLPILNNKISWYGNVLFSYNKNKITKLRKTVSYDNLISGLPSQGSSMSDIWGIKYAYNTVTKEPMYIGGGGKSYKIMSTDISGGEANGQKFLVNLGHTTPSYIVSFQNSFKIYNFNMSFLLTGRFGNKYRSSSFNYPTIVASFPFGHYVQVNKEYKNAKNSNPQKILPVNIKDPVYPMYQISPYIQHFTYMYKNAGVIRLQEVNLSYDLPKRMTSKIGLSSVQVYGQGSSLGSIFFNDKNEDPEYPRGSLKLQATYTFGLRVTL